MIKIIKHRIAKKFPKKPLSKKLNIKTIQLFHSKLIFVLLFILFLVEFYDNNKNFEEKIEKDLASFDLNNSQLNWKNVNNDFEFLIDKYKYLLTKEKNIEEDSPIWVMWYQGIKNAPPIVKSCIQSIIENREKHPVYIISKYNLDKYIKLPYYIFEKLKQRKINIEQFSGIIRFALLCKYGGYWVDSNYFITSPLTKVSASFYSLKLTRCWIHNHPYIKCLFSSGFMAVSKNSFIATYGLISFLYYLKKYNSFITYFMIDYIINIAYTKVPEFKNKINKLPLINCSVFRLERKLNNYFKISDFKCPFNKLKLRSAKKIFDSKRITNYGYIVEKFKFEIKNNSNNYTLNI